MYLQAFCPEPLRAEEDQMKILISLKSRVLSEALHGLIQKEPSGDHVLIAEGGTDESGFRPDLILVDRYNINRNISERSPQTKVLLVDTGLDQEEVINLLLLHKLDGVVSTDADAFLLKKAMNLVHEGQIWIDNNNLKALLYRAGTISQNGKLASVSKREQQVLDLINKGFKNKEIAEQLYLSEQTIKAHISRIFRKFNVSSRSQLFSLLLNAPPS